MMEPAENWYGSALHERDEYIQDRMPRRGRESGDAVRLREAIQVLSTAHPLKMQEGRDARPLPQRIRLNHARREHVADQQSTRGVFVDT